MWANAANADAIEMLLNRSTFKTIIIAAAFAVVDCNLEPFLLMKEEVVGVFEGF